MCLIAWGIIGVGYLVVRGLHYLSNRARCSYCSKWFTLYYRTYNIGECDSLCKTCLTLRDEL